MERRTFFKNSLLTAGGVLLGSPAIFRLLKGSKSTENSPPATIEKVHQGNGKNVLVLMSAGTRQGNTDRLTDACIKGLTEKNRTVTKVYLGSMRMSGCYGCGACQRNGNLSGR